jgi:hypothetical protein
VLCSIGKTKRNLLPSGVTIRNKETTMGTETYPQKTEPEQEDVFIKLSSERRIPRYIVQVSDNPDDLPPPPLKPVNYDTKESENG